MAFVSATALSLAVVAIGGPTPWGTGGPEIVRVCDPDRTYPDRSPVVYDLAPIEVQASVRGPRHRGALAYPRTAGEVATELAAVQKFDRGPFRACYRWARWAKPDLEGDLGLGVEVDEWGRVARVAAVTDSIDPAAAACFSEALAGMRVGLYTPRRTRLELRFQLKPSGQARLKRRPRRYAASRRDADTQRVCVEQPAVLPIDVLDDPASIVIDDFSKEQADDEKREQYRADHAAWIAGGRRGSEPKLPPDVIGCGANVRGVPKEEDVQAAIGYQRGDFEACYADAARRGYQRGGDVTLAAIVNRAGQFDAARIAKSTTKDAALDGCLSRALEHAHVATGVGGVFRVNVPLHLAPGRAPIPFTRDNEDFAGDAIDEGDDETALTLYRTVLASAPALRRCSIAVGLLQAALSAAPWQEDPRVSAAVDGVREALRAAPKEMHATCEKQATPLLAAWVARPFQLARATRRPDLMAPVVERARRLLGFQPPLPIAETVRAHRDEALRMMKPADGTPGCCGSATFKWGRVPELHGVLPEPTVGAMEVRDALIYMRSLRMTGERFVLCREVAAIADRSSGDQMRRLRFMDCPASSGGIDP